MTARYLATTLALLAVAVGYGVSQRWTEPPPPRPVRGPAAAARPALPPAPPAAREILDRAAGRALTPEQAARLEALDRQWIEEAAGLLSALEAARSEFSRFVAETQATRGTGVGEIQRRSAEYRELSADFRERRRLHGEAALGLLTDSQRRSLAPATSPDTRGGGQ